MGYCARLESVLVFSYAAAHIGKGGIELAIRSKALLRYRITVLYFHALAIMPAYQFGESRMNNLQKAIHIELPKLLAKLSDKMDNAKTPAEYRDAESLYLFLTTEESI